MTKTKQVISQMAVSTFTYTVELRLTITVCYPSSVTAEKKIIRRLDDRDKLFVVPKTVTMKCIQIILNVTAVEEEEIDEDVEDTGLDLKPLTSHLEAEAMLSKCIDWFEV